MMMQTAFTFRCLCALQFVHFHGAVAQSDTTVSRILVNGGFKDVIIDEGQQVRLQCEADSQQVDADYFRNRDVVELPLFDSRSNTRVIASMSVEYQGGYKCRPKQQQDTPKSINEIAIISKWAMP